MPDPRSCIGSLSALGPVHDLWLIASDVMALSISGSDTEGKIEHVSDTKFNS